MPRLVGDRLQHETLFTQSLLLCSEPLNGLVSSALISLNLQCMSCLRAPVLFDSHILEDAAT